MQQLLVEKQQALAGQQPQLQLQPQPQPQPQQPELEELALTDPYVLQSPKANIPASGIICCVLHITPSHLMSCAVTWCRVSCCHCAVT